MGFYVVNEDGTRTIRFGKDRSSGIGGGGIDVPPGKYNCRVAEWKEQSGRAEGPEGASMQVLLRCEIYEPEESGGMPTKGHIIPVYLPVPEDKADGTDKKVCWLWEGLFLAMGTNVHEVAEDDDIQFSPEEEAVGTAVEVEVRNETYQGKIRSKGLILGPATIGGEVEEASTEEASTEEAPIEEAPSPKPTTTQTRNGATVKPPMSQAKPLAKPLAKPAARTAPPPARTARR